MIDILNKELVGKPIRVCVSRNIILTTNSVGLEKSNPYSGKKKLGYHYIFEDTFVKEVFCEYIDIGLYTGNNICLKLHNGRVCLKLDENSMNKYNSVDGIPYCLTLLTTSNYRKHKFFLISER